MVLANLCSPLPNIKARHDASDQSTVNMNYTVDMSEAGYVYCLTYIPPYTNKPFLLNLIPRLDKSVKHEYVGV